MNNLVVLPILLPLLTGVILVFFRRRTALQKGLAAASAAGTLLVSLLLVEQVSRNGIQTLYVGGWRAPFGITLVADMVSALLLAVASLVTLACLLYAFASIGKEREHYYVYPFIQILVCGVNGSFLTGDIFNLFVFFEVMLIASYVLLSMGGGKVQLRETIKYVLINIVSSTLFVIAIAYLYGVTGTLNMAHLSERVAEVGQDGLLTTISLLLLIVFAIKAALFLYYWLPGSYSVPPAAIAALFAALLTKVGMYALLRLFTLVFYHRPEITHTVMIGLGALTMVLGAIGAVSYWKIKKILAYNIIISVGFIVFGIGLASGEALGGALFYLLHDMVAKALVFILGGAIIAIFGTDNLREISGVILFRPLLGWMMFISVLAMAGVPPLSGFVGKVMILLGGLEREQYLVTAVGLITSLLVLYSLIKVFINSFWGESLMGEGEEQSTGRAAIAPGLLLTACVFALGLGAEWVLGYVQQAVDTMMNPAIYIDAVLYETGAP